MCMVPSRGRPWPRGSSEKQIFQSFSLLDTAPDMGGALNTLLAEEGRPPLPPERIRPAVSHGATALVRLAFGLGPEHGKPARFTEPLLEALGLAQRAACIVSGDTAPARKPDPRPLLHACGVTGVLPEECVYVGDARRDVEAAHAAGMPALVALFGYLDGADDPAAWGAELADTFRALSSAALRESSESFLQLARTQLEARERAIQDMLRPIREALEKTERQIREIEKERREAYGSLSQHLRAVLESHQALQAETRRLVQALRRPEVRGQWGELTLRRLVELAGMQAHCDFEEQPTAAGEAGRLRPDLVVHLPEGRRIVVDAKTPLDAYLEAVEAEDEEARGCWRRRWPSA